MIDETSARKGHRYVTVVLDADSHELLLMVEGRSAQAITELLAAMPAHGAKAEAITEVVMDMSPAYIAGVQSHFPNARIVRQPPGSIKIRADDRRGIRFGEVGLGEELSCVGASERHWPTKI